jgi:poly(3-hydroxybutyrate) depolymerase
MESIKLLLVNIVFNLVVVCATNTIIRPYSVSGVSSGAFMAIQHHVSYNKDVVGVGAIAGGPFFCAQDKVEIALHACMSAPEFISVAELVTITYATYTTTRTIDNPSYTKGDKIWLFSGVQDKKVKPAVVVKTFSYYSALGAEDSDIELRDDIQAAHAMVTDKYGNNCNYFGSPYIDNCNFDAAGHMLQHFYNGKLKPRVEANKTFIVKFSQSQYIPSAINASLYGLADVGYAYVPLNCQGKMKNCDFHVAYHGCLQAFENVNTTFVENAGYNEWGEANNIIILYPQAASNAFNPESCWDWWGYTGPGYASKVGLQLSIIGEMMEDFMSRD